MADREPALRRQRPQSYAPVEVLADEAVDAVFRDPPQSTAQILHIDKYRNHVAPVEVDLPDLSTGALGNGWREISTNIFGELDLRLTDGSFIRAFLDKGRFGAYLRRIPVRVLSASVSSRLWTSSCGLSVPTVCEVQGKDRFGRTRSVAEIPPPRAVQRNCVCKV